MSIDLMTLDSEVAAEVSVTGPGISVENQARLFRRLHRPDKSRQQRVAGTGLGLSITRAVAEQHGGEAYCRSQARDDSTFGFTLPVTGE